MSDQIPAIALPFVSDRAKKALDQVCLSLHLSSVFLLQSSPSIKDNKKANPLFFNDTQVRDFVEKDCIPADTVAELQTGTGAARWQSHPAIIDDLKIKARKLGLWNMFLAKSHFKEGAGYSNLEYGLMAEWLGRSRTASEVSLLGGIWFLVWGL